MNEIKIIEWKGWCFSVKPFTPRVYFALSEGVYAETQNGAYLSGGKKVAIETLLVPLDTASKIALDSGTLVNSLFDAETDAEAAFGIMETLGFLSTEYMERGTRLLSAQKDLDSSILQTPKPSTLESQMDSETAQDSSGAVEAT